MSRHAGAATSGNTRTRVLLVAPLYPPLHSGAGRQAASWLERTTAELDVTVLTLGRPDLPEREAVPGGTVLRVGSVGARRPARAFGLAVLRRLPALLRSTDVVLVLGVAPATYAALALCRLRRMPCLVKLTLEGEDDPATLARKTGGGRRLALLRGATRVVCPTQRMADLALRQGFDPNRLMVIPNGVDTERFHPPDELAPLTEAVYVGALEARKNVHLLLDAAETLIPEFPDLRLHLVGGEGRAAHVPEDAAYAARLRERAGKPPLQGRVVLHGRLDNPETVLREVGVFFLPSKAEGLPNALLEAMAAGLVPAASDLPGVREVIEQGRNGIVVEEPTGDAWAAAWREILENPDEARAIAEKARTRMTDHFCLADTALAYAAMLRRAATRRAG